jgi:hypothetical protein
MTRTPFCFVIRHIKLNLMQWILDNRKKYNPEKHVFGKIPVTDKRLVYFSNLRHLGVS